jgi:GNAT superfamily N-acetyltransferase
VNIRAYQESDFKELAGLYRDFFNEMRDWQGWEQLKLDKKEATETAAESLGSNSRVFVAEDRKKLIGFARVQLWDGAYFVREVFVARPYRMTGVGTELLKTCEDWVRKEGETSIYLTVEPKHSVSLQFLIRNGYDTLNMLELRKELVETDFPERAGQIEILNHKLRLLKRRL